MAKRKKRNNRRWYVIAFTTALIFCLLVFTNPGKYFLYWLNSQFGSQKNNYEKITKVGVTLPDGYSIFGIDVSHYQNDIDWVRVADFKSEKFTVEFAFIKATEGTSMIDSYFKKNWNETKDVGIPRGAYHYFKPNVNAQLQADHFCRNVVMSKGDLPPVLDIEETANGIDKKSLVNSVYIWLQIVERHYGVRPIVYTGAFFYETYFRGSIIEKYPLWIAHYYEEKPATFADWKFWQFSDKAKIDGINHHVDVNVFYGNYSQLNDLKLK